MMIAPPTGDNVPADTHVPDVPVTDEDPLRQYLNRRELVTDRERLMFHADERRIQDLARDRTPMNMQQAEDSLTIANLDNNQMKACLKVLNVAGAHNARQAIKKKIIATKLVQHKLAVGVLTECIADADKERPNMVTEKHLLVRKLPRTAVKVVLSPSGALERLAWLRGDVPTYDEEGQVIPGKSAHEAGETEEDIVVQQADFEPTEYCRLLHVLADQRMTEARAALMENRGTDELWQKEITPLFNDESFAPEPIKTLAGGIKNTDIAGMAPQHRPFVRDHMTLKRKFAEFKSMYRAAVRNYMQSPQSDTHPFRNFSQDWPFVMYAFCLTKVYTELQPLLSRALASDASRTQGRNRLGEEDAGSQKKRRLSGADGVEFRGLHAVQMPRPNRETAALLKETHKAERDKALAEATEAHSRSVTSLLVAIKQTREMLQEADSEDEQVLYSNVLKELKARLTNGTSGAEASPV